MAVQIYETAALESGNNDIRSVSLLSVGLWVLKFGEVDDWNVQLRRDLATRKFDVRDTASDSLRAKCCSSSVWCEISAQSLIIP
jgi:hypothetical protein